MFTYLYHHTTKARNPSFINWVATSFQIQQIFCSAQRCFQRRVQHRAESPPAYSLDDEYPRLLQPETEVSRCGLWILGFKIAPRWCLLVAPPFFFPPFKFYVYMGYDRPAYLGYFVSFIVGVFRNMCLCVVGTAPDRYYLPGSTCSRYWIIRSDEDRKT